MHFQVKKTLKNNLNHTFKNTQDIVFFVEILFWFWLFILVLVGIHVIGRIDLASLTLDPYPLVIEPYSCNFKIHSFWEMIHSVITSRGGLPP